MLIPLQFFVRVLGEIFFFPSLSSGLPLVWLVAAAVCLARSGWGRGPIRHHHIYASCFLLPPQWDLLSPCCELFPQNRLGLAEAPCVLAHFTLPIPLFVPGSIPQLPRCVRASIRAAPPPIPPQNRVLVRLPAQIRGVLVRIWMDFGGFLIRFLCPQGLFHGGVRQIWRGRLSLIWPPSGRLRPASHVSNPELLEKQLRAPRGAVREARREACVGSEFWAGGEAAAPVLPVP